MTAADESSLHDFERGQLLVGRYLMKGRLESGGMGEVYIARDQVLSRDVAIKRVRLDGDVPPDQLPLFAKRFEQEAKAVAKLRHPNIVTVHDVQQVRESPFIVMEYFKGGVPLIKWGNQTKPTIAQWLKIAKVLFSAVHHAHSRGLLHRDIKSGNVLARGSADVDEVELLLIDWGIALHEGATRLTQINGVIGTPGAIDPAVLKGGVWSHQSDFFALGLLLYQCFCGTKPHDIPKDTPSLNLPVIYAENKIIPPYKANPAIDNDLQTFLVRLLMTDPAERPPSARAAIAMIEALERGDDVDFDGLSAKYPTTAQVIDEDELEEVDPTDADPPRKPGTVRLEVKSAARQLLGEFADNSGEHTVTKRERSPEGREKTPTKELSGLGALDKQEIKDVEHAQSDSPSGSPLDARIAPFRNDEPQTQKAKPRGLQYAMGGIVVVILLGLFFAKRQNTRVTAATTAPPAAIEPMDPAELQRRDQEPGALDKFAAEKLRASGNGSLDKIDPDTRAQYAANNNAIGGTIPPTPAALRGNGSIDARPSKEPAKIDRSMRPAGLDDASNNKNDVLPIKYGTRVEVRLLEMLDTSSGEPVKALLLTSLTIDSSRVIPAGSTLFGKASLRVAGNVVRSQAHFDHVLYPNGEQQRIAAVSIKPDGSEGLSGGQFEYGDPETGSDTAGKAGSIAKDAALEGLGALPGGNALNGTLKAVADDAASAIGKGEQRARRKNRMLVPKDTLLTIQFQPANVSH